MGRILVKLTRFFANDRGTATLEYIIVLTMVSIGVSSAIVAMGPSLVRFFEIRVMWLSLPIP